MLPPELDAGNQCAAFQSRIAEEDAPISAKITIDTDWEQA